VPDLEHASGLPRRAEPIPQRLSKGAVTHRALLPQELSADTPQANFGNSAIHGNLRTRRAFLQSQPQEPPRHGLGIIDLMPRDCLGNALSAASPGILRAIDDFIGGFLAYEQRAERIVGAADEAADCCIANVYAGFLWMLLEAPSGAGCAAPYLAAAARTAPDATRREQLNAAVLRAWIADDVPGALRACSQVTDEFPRDLVILKIEQYLEFNRGDFPAMLRAALKVLEQNADVAYVHGMAAFAYEECQLLGDAERAARRALDLERKEPWAQHALAHVMLTQGRIEEGARFLESVAPTWTDLNSFMITHLWWHAALFDLSRGRFARALEIYDRHCWGVAKEYSQDQVGAVSLLSRLEIAGIDVGQRWQDLADHLAARAEDTVQPFLTLQYLYGLARAGRAEARTLLEAVRQRADSAPAHAREVWREVVLPASEGLHAYARHDYDRAWRELGRAMPRMIEAGGSHAQRDFFEQILLDAAMAGGRLSAAQQTLELRRAADPDGVPVNTALAGVYEKLGLATLAAEARARAAATRDRHRE
jgi:tetratricopeptide (TPR) repeat protein